MDSVFIVLQRHAGKTLNKEGGREGSIWYVGVGSKEASIMMHRGITRTASLSSLPHLPYLGLETHIERVA